MRSVWTRPRVLTGAAAAAAGPVPSDSISLSLMFAPPLFFKKWEEQKNTSVSSKYCCVVLTRQPKKTVSLFFLACLPNLTLLHGFPAPTRARKCFLTQRLRILPRNYFVMCGAKAAHSRRLSVRLSLHGITNPKTNEIF